MFLNTCFLKPCSERDNLIIALIVSKVWPRKRCACNTKFYGYSVCRYSIRIESLAVHWKCHKSGSSCGKDMISLWLPAQAHRDTGHLLQVRHGVRIYRYSKFVLIGGDTLEVPVCDHMRVEFSVKDINIYLRHFPPWQLTSVYFRKQSCHIGQFETIQFINWRM